MCANRIKLEPEQLFRLSEKLRNAVNDIQGRSMQLSTSYSTIDWTFSYSSCVDSKVAQAESLKQQVIKDLTSLSEFIKKSAIYLDEADKQNNIGKITLLPIFLKPKYIIGIEPIPGTRWIGVPAMPSLPWIRSCIYNPIDYVLELERLGKENASNPVPGGIYRGEGNEFGRLEFPTDFPKGHSGIDIQPSDKTNNPNPEILAAFGGKVSKIGYDADGYGHYVVVDTIIDGKSYQVFYGHLKEGSINIQVGNMIPGGTQVGRMGTSGASTGVHLHFEIRQWNGDPGHGNYEPVDPVLYCKTLWCHQ